MPRSADIGTKRLISLAPESWVKWATQIPDIVAGELVGGEIVLSRALPIEQQLWKDIAAIALCQKHTDPDLEIHITSGGNSPKRSR